MKQKLLLSLALAVAVNVIGPASAGPVKSYKDIKTPAMNDLQVPEPVIATLSNGLKLYLLEDSELPLINIRARVRVGSAFEPADKIGLASITGTVMRTGGTKTRTGDELDELLEGLAASVETGIGTTEGFAGVSVLKEDLDTGLEILADVLMNPEFRQEKIDLAITEQKSAISRRNDDPAGIAGREFFKRIYGADSPYARIPEYSTVESITRDDLIAFHAKYFHPNNTMMAIWGDFDADDMVKKVEAALSGWKAKEPLDLTALPTVEYEFKPGVFLIEREDATQSQIRMGHIGIKQDNPDYFAIIVMNRVFGAGGFSARLFQNVRSRKGLAYSVGGGVFSNIEYPGAFRVVCSTKSETTAEAIEAIQVEINRMIAEDVTAEELAQAKESYLNSFVFNFDTTREIVNRLMAYDFYGYPKDFLQKTKENVEKVSIADVRRVAQEYMKPDALQLLVVGKSADFDKPLDTFGDVASLDITIPEPVEEMGEATAEDLAKGKEVLAKMVGACGGQQAAKEIKNIQIKTDMEVSMQGQKMAIAGDMTMVYPDRMVMVMNLPFGEMSQIYNGEAGWAKSPMGEQAMGESEKAEIIASMFRDWVSIYQKGDALEVRYLGSKDVDGVAADVISVSEGDASVKIYVSTADGMPLMQAYRGQTMMGPASMEEKYSEWQEVAGVMLPYKTVIYADGSEFVSSTVSDIQANVSVDESVFVKPEAEGQ